MAKSSASRSFNNAFEEVWQAARAAVEAHGASISATDQAGGTIEARLGISLMSWGEAIQVAVSHGAAPPTNVTIESRSRMPLTLIDWGKNSRNVKQVFGHLEAALSPSGAGSLQ